MDMPISILRDHFRYDISDLAHFAAENWTMAAEAAEAELADAPEGDEWTEDMQAALAGIAQAFRAAAKAEAEYKAKRASQMQGRAGT